MTTMNAKSSAPVLTSPEAVDAAAAAEGEAFVKAQAAEIARLTALLAQATSRPAAKTIPITWKVSDKGVVVVTGVPGTMALSAEPEGWIRLLDKADGLRAFCEANAATLNAKRAAWKASPEFKAEAAKREAARAEYRLTHPK